MIFKNFLNIKNSKIIKKDFLKLLKDQPALFETLKPTYKYSYSKKIIKKYKKLNRKEIDVVFLGAWNFKKEIFKKEKNR